MRDFDENSITRAVIESIQTTASPRVREISQSLVRHLHDFVREVEPTTAEWGFAIDFLTRTGQMCDERRQEFILLSDALGVSMLVDAINHRLPGGATETTVLGPFYVEGAPEHALGDDVSGGMPGERLLVEGSASTIDGKPLPGAIVDIWHSDKDGYYDVQQMGDSDEFAMRARLKADDNGRFWFWTIVPSFYPIPNDGPVGQMLEAQGRHPYRPAHVHFMIAAPGYVPLVTHIFIDGDKYLDSDVVFGVKNSLIRSLERHEGGRDPAGNAIEGAYAKLSYDFALAPSVGDRT